MKTFTMLYTYKSWCYTFLVISVFSVQLKLPSVAQSRNLATRLMPPPSVKLSNEENDRRVAPKHNNAKQLVLQHQNKNQLNHQLLSGFQHNFTPKPTIEDIRNAQKYYDWFYVTNQDRGAKPVEYEQLKNFQKKRSPKIVGHDIRGLLTSAAKTRAIHPTKLETKSKTSFTPSPQYTPRTTANSIFSSISNIATKLNETFWIPTLNSFSTLNPLSLKISNPLPKETTSPILKLTPTTQSPLTEKNAIFRTNPSLIKSTRQQRILYPKPIQNDKSWTPVYRGTVLPAVNEIPTSGSNTFAKEFASFGTAPPISRTPTSSEFKLQYLSQSISPDLKSNKKTNNILSPAIIRKRKIETSPLLKSLITKKNNELVIHLNSTVRIKELIGILTDYLKNPVHQLSTKIASISPSPRDPIISSNLTSEFENGFLSVLNSSSSVSNSTPEITRLPLENKFSFFGERLQSNDQYNLNDHHHFSQALQRPQLPKSVPTPIKIDVNETYDQDLIYSPSVASLLTISNSVDSEITSFPPTPLDYLYNIRRKSDLLLKTKASSCPKLFGQLTLICEIPDEIKHDILVSLSSKFV